MISEKVRNGKNQVLNSSSMLDCLRTVGRKKERKKERKFFLRERKIKNISPGGTHFLKRKSDRERKKERKKESSL